MWSVYVVDSSNYHQCDVSGGLRRDVSMTSFNVFLAPLDLMGFFMQILIGESKLPRAEVDSTLREVSEKLINKS